MKPILFCAALFLATVAGFGQPAQEASSHVEAYYNSSLGRISYNMTGDVPKDGLKLIDEKTTALDIYSKLVQSQPDMLVAIQKEKESLEALRQRILVQRERMQKPLPPLQEVH